MIPVIASVLELPNFKRPDNHGKSTDIKRDDEPLSEN